jgi:hypothetical protein
MVGAASKCTESVMIAWKRIVVATVACGVCLLSAACAGGGGGGSADIPVTPVTPTPPTPQPFAFTGASVTYASQAPVLSPASVTATTTAATPFGSDIEVTITEPDTPSFNRLDQVNFNGNETIVLKYGGNQQATIQNTSNTVTRGQFVFGSASQGFGARTVAMSSWTISPFGPSSQTTSFSVHQLNGVASTTGRPVDGTTLTKYVKVFSYYTKDPNASYDNGIFGTFGAPTDAASMPTTGTLHYGGEAIGRYFAPTSPALGGAPFVAVATADVNFGLPSSQVSGAISGPLYNGAAGPDFQLQYTGTITRNTFAGAATATGPGAMSGNVTGAFYGPSTAAAAEIGGSVSVTGAGGQLVGGFVGAH